MTDAWEPLAARFVDGHYGSTRGKIRTEVVHRHLLTHLPQPPADLVDVGGGAAHQSLPLARCGYRVTLVDPSPAMLDRARRRRAAEPAEVAMRLELVEASAEDAPEVLGGRTFAGVLCHGVVMYVDDVERFIGALCRLGDPTGGVVSVVAKNARSLAARPAFAGDWAAARAAFDERWSRNGLGVETRADTVEELSEMLAAHGVDVTAWYGVRLFSEVTPFANETADPTHDMIEVELEASRRDPYRQLSRLFHLVGVRRQSP